LLNFLQVIDTGNYFVVGGKPCCEADFSTGQICAKCGQKILGVVIDALGKKWHAEHFVCSYCPLQLANVEFLENNGKQYCKPCHKKLFE